MTGHYTAIVVTDHTYLTGDYANLLVIEDHIFGHRLDPDGNPDPTKPLWESSGDCMFRAADTIRWDLDHTIILKQADEILNTVGWTTTTEWERVPTGYTATATRKA